MFRRKSTNDEIPAAESSRSERDPRPEGSRGTTINEGRTGYDALIGLGRWIRSSAKWIGIALFVVASGWLIGWYAAASVVAGVVLWWFLLDRFVNDSGAVLLDECRDGVWTTWSVGQDAWRELDLKGIPFAFRSGDGRPRYLAESFNPVEGKVTFAWIHQLSSWKFFLSFRAHKSLLEVLEKVLPENIKLRLYPRILGYREAKAAMQPIGDLMDRDLLQTEVESDLWIKSRESIDSFFDLGLDEIIDQPEQEKKTGTEESH